MGGVGGESSRVVLNSSEGWQGPFQDLKIHSKDETKCSWMWDANSDLGSEGLL